MKRHRTVFIASYYELQKKTCFIFSATLSLRGDEDEPEEQQPVHQYRGKKQDTSICPETSPPSQAASLILSLEVRGHAEVEVAV
jgi:hypothetical protein